MKPTRSLLYVRAIWLMALVLTVMVVITTPLAVSGAKYVAAGTGNAKARIAAFGAEYITPENKAIGFRNTTTGFASTPPTAPTQRVFTLMVSNYSEVTCDIKIVLKYAKGSGESVHFQNDSGGWLSGGSAVVATDLDGDYDIRETSASSAAAPVYRFPPLTEEVPIKYAINRRTAVTATSRVYFEFEVTQVD